MIVDEDCIHRVFSRYDDSFKRVTSHSPFQIFRYSIP